MKHYILPYLNEKGASVVKVVAITLIFLILFGGAASIYFQIKDKVDFSEEETAKATEIAQAEFAKVSSLTQNYDFDDRFEGIESIGFKETKDEGSTITYEKVNNETNYYILLKIKPHDTYPDLSRVLIQIFDKENGSLITELENVVKWKDNK